MVDMTEQAERLIRSLAKDLGPLVEEIEAGVPTTKDNYNRYMSVLSGFKGNYRLACAVALIRAGAPRAGVNTALRNV